MVKRFAQVWFVITSLTCETETPGQLSDTVTAAMFAGGTFEAQLTVTGAGQVICGFSSSVTVMVKEQFPLPQLFEAVSVTVVVPTRKKDPLPDPDPLPEVAPLKL